MSPSVKDYLEAESMASSAGRHDPFRDDGEGSDDDDDVDPDGEDEPKLSTRFQAHDMRACLAVVIERLEYEMQGNVDLEDVEQRINRLFERDTNLPPDRQAEQVNEARPRGLARRRRPQPVGLDDGRQGARRRARAHNTASRVGLAVRRCSSLRLAREHLSVLAIHIPEPTSIQRTEE